MKFSTAALVALFAASAQAFSVSMSSIGYLDNLGGSAGVKSSPPASYAPFNTSFKTGGMAPVPVAAPMPAPMGAPAAPAPAPASSYTSGLANAPANSDLNYLKTIGGGSAMKSGRNYSGVSQSFRPVRPSIPSHTESLSGKTMAPPSYGSAPQSYAAPAAPAPAPMAYSAPAPTPAYGSSPAPTPVNYSSFPPGPGSASYRRSSDYTGINKNPKPVRGAFGSYLDTL